MANNKYTVIYSREKKWIVARCLEIDVVSQGKTHRSAEKNIREAISLYLDSFGEENIPKYKKIPLVKRIILSKNDSITTSVRKRAYKVLRKTGIRKGAAKRKSRLPEKART